MTGQAKKQGRMVPGEDLMRKLGSDRMVERAGIPDDEGAAMNEVIAALRALIREVSERAGEPLDTPTLLEILQGVGLGGTRLASLLKTRRALAEDGAGGDGETAHKLLDWLNQKLKDLEK